MSFESNFSPITMSITETAAYLGIGRTSVYLLFATNELSSIRVGRRRLVTTKSIVELVERSRVPADGGAALRTRPAAPHDAVIVEFPARAACGPAEGAGR
jgi:excisionase family DNA binding protein